MFRFATVALCLTASITHADTRFNLRHPTSGEYVASHTNPINYRANRAAGRVVIRSNAYDESNTVRIKRRRAGVTTGQSVTPPQGYAGQDIPSGLELQTLANN